MTRDRRTWAKVPAAAVADADLSNAALRTLAALAMHADRNGRCRLKVETIAAIRGVTRQAIQMDLFALKRRGYVTLTPTMRRCGGNGANHFEILYPPLPAEIALAGDDD